MGITPRWKHRFPAGTDTPLPSRDLRFLAEDLDNTVKDTQGLLANRPTSTSTGQYYFATDNTTLYRANGTTWNGLPSTQVTPVVTTLPASPTDGQEVLYQPAGLPNGVIWGFKYRSAAASYRWEFTGGSPLILREEPSHAMSTTNTSWPALAFTTPSITGSWHVAVTGIAYGNTVGATIYSEVRYGASSGFQTHLGVTAINAINSYSAEGRLFPVPGGQTINLFNRTSAGGGYTQNRSLRICPIRLAG